MKPKNNLVILIFAVIFLVASTSVNMLTESPTGALAGTVGLTIEEEVVPAPPPVVVERRAAPAPVYAPPKPIYYIGNLDITYEHFFRPYLNELWVYTYIDRNYTLELLSIGQEIQFKHLETREVFAIEEGETIQIDSDGNGIKDVFITSIDIGLLTERPLARISIERPPPLLKLVHFSTFILLAILIAAVSILLIYLAAKRKKKRKKRKKRRKK